MKKLIVKIGNSFTYLRALGVIIWNGRLMRRDFKMSMTEGGNYEDISEYLSVILALEFALVNNFVTDGVSAKVGKAILRRELKMDIELYDSFGISETTFEIEEF